MWIEVRAPSLIILVGISGAGKSTFARKHFASTEILSSDHCRALVSDDENDQSVTSDAFALLTALARMRLRHGRLCIVDATNLEPRDRLKYVQIANEFHCGVGAIVMEAELDVCLERMQSRSDRRITEAIVRRQFGQFRASLPSLPLEGFFPIWHVDDAEGVEIVRI